MSFLDMDEWLLELAKNASMLVRQVLFFVKERLQKKKQAIAPSWNF
jgi:hypothetical protein